MRLNELRGKLFGLVRPLENGLQRWRFVLSLDQEQYARRIVQDRSGHGDAFGEKLSDPVRDDQPLLFIERLCAGKQRGGVTVRPHPEQDKIESRELPLRELEELAERLFVFLRRPRRFGV